MRYCCCILLFLACLAGAQEPAADRGKDTYVHAVTRGAGLMPWQEAGVSDEEAAFRARMEARKDELLRHSAGVAHPVLYTADDIARAKANGARDERAQSWIDNQIGLADNLVEKDRAWVESMIPEEAPSHNYGFTCPVCVGDKSQEAVGSPLMTWSYTDPDHFECRACGQRFPDPAFPETAELILPRTGYRIPYYLNDAERAEPEDRSGDLAWHWVGYPIHVSFTGIIREQKIGFMRTAARALAMAYAFTGDVRYAEQCKAILVRFAHCYRKWPYRDYWDGYADCDPLYAAWHDKDLPIEWKRHLTERAYRNDTLDKAAMMQTYWGAGRMHPSTDSVSGLPMFAMAYDLTCTATASDGTSVWTADERRLVERDLLLEYVFGAEPYIGGPGKADNHNNKAPRIYNAMASIAKCLGIPAYADVALQGYEKVRDDSFNADGMSTESPSYNNMYLSQLLVVPETLHGFAWPDDYPARSGIVDYYSTDTKLRSMYRGVLWSLLPDGSYLPLSDTHVHGMPSDHIVHMGLKRYPDLYSGTLPAVDADRVSEYALFNLDLDELNKDTGLDLPETLFPDWQTAVLRHGDDVLTMAFNPFGGHRHHDNLALYYNAGGRGVIGDHGYVGDMPINTWIRDTRSHALVVVDDSEQAFQDRKPSLRMMATTPLASVVEAETDAYGQCGTYRRTITLIKMSETQTIAVDIFRVRGGAKHAFRLYSEVAASDESGGALTFEGVTMPDEAPLPEVGSSLATEDIFGLRDVRSAKPSEEPWSATWRDESGAYRLWMASPVDRVEASNGPGQRDLKEAGRRVRYIDAVREGENLASTFVAVHEPGAGTVTSVELQDAGAAGPDAVALKIETPAATYWVLCQFDNPIAIAGTTFQGDLCVLRGTSDTMNAYVSIAASQLIIPGQSPLTGQFGYAATPKSTGANEIVVESASYIENIAIEPGAQAYVRVQQADGTWTGYPVDRIDNDRIRVKTYPLPKDITAYELLSVRYKSWQ